MILILSILGILIKEPTWRYSWRHVFCRFKKSSESVIGFTGWGIKDLLGYGDACGRSSVDAILIRLIYNILYSLVKWPTVFMGLSIIFSRQLWLSDFCISTCLNNGLFYCRFYWNGISGWHIFRIFPYLFELFFHFFLLIFLFLLYFFDFIDCFLGRVGWCKTNSWVKFFLSVFL